MKVNILLVLLFLCGYTLATSINSSHQSERLQDGDLLFQDLDCGALCDAIKAVTESVNGKNFSHCAIVVKINDTLKVIEAIGEKVQVNSLQHFFERCGHTTTLKCVTIARVKNKYKKLLIKATAFAKQQIGQPYDAEFLLNNGKWYCSELLFEAFKVANNQKDFFDLAPMTFKDSKTNAYFPAWVAYYKHLNTAIPEGMLGTNPGLISRSNKINIIKISDWK